MTTNPIEPNSNEAKLAAFRYADSRVLLNVIAAELGTPSPTAPQYPAWVVKCAHKVAQAIYPKVYAFKEGIQPTEYHIGLAYGMMTGGEERLEITLAALDLELDGEPTEQQIAATTNVLYGENSGVTLPKDGSSLMPIEVQEDFKRWVSEMTVEGKAEFHAGISDALSMIAGKNQSTPATARYSTMLIYWKVVEAFKTMEQLHDFLTKVHGQNIVGSDIKGTRQLCDRVGKRFRPPGRPKLPQAPGRLR